MVSSQHYSYNNIELCEPFPSVLWMLGYTKLVRSSFECTSQWERDRQVFWSQFQEKYELISETRQVCTVYNMKLSTFCFSPSGNVRSYQQCVFTVYRTLGKCWMVPLRSWRKHVRTGSILNQYPLQGLARYWAVQPHTPYSHSSHNSAFIQCLIDLFSFLFWTLLVSEQCSEGWGVWVLP